MKTTKIFIALAAVFIAHTALAQSNHAVGPQAKNVNVTNDEASPIPVTIHNTVPTIVEYRYIGLTTHVDDGDFEFGNLKGLAAMNKACSSEFGFTARVATITEALFRDDAITDTRDGWLAPSGPMTFGVEPFDFRRAGQFPIDQATGFRLGATVLGTTLAAQYAFCGRYTAPEVFFIAPVIESTGLVATGSCSIAKPVACSAPVAMPAIY